MSLAVPLTVGVLGQQIRDQGLNVCSFSNLISSESAKIKGMLPARMDSLLSAGPIPSAITASTTASNPGIVKEIVTLIGLLVLAVIAWPLSGGADRTSRLPPLRLPHPHQFPDR